MPHSTDASEPSGADRQFAWKVVQTLRRAGFEALWAGGCVRDLLLGREPKDYDVATSATPDEVRQLFGRRRTLPIGASFGVVVLLGPPDAGQIEIATFRTDGDYRDGRHPDSVHFGTAEQDALRRDFTINGLFYDPLEDQTYDFVGGRADLDAGVIRAIGDAHARLDEDKLRLLRAIRFAARFEFVLESETEAAIAARPHDIAMVSAERIAAEMRLMLIDSHRSQALRLLRRTGLLPAVLHADLQIALFGAKEKGDEQRWQQMLQVVDSLGDAPPFPLALAAALWGLVTDDGEWTASCLQSVAAHWKLSNQESSDLAWYAEHQRTIRQACDIPWPRLQPVLIDARAKSLIPWAAALARTVDATDQHIKYCRDKLSLPSDILDPVPLITGADLMQHKIPPGPIYRVILQTVRDAQLEGTVTRREQVWPLVERVCQSSQASAGDD